MLGRGVLGAVDDPQVLATAALDRRLNEAPAAAGDEVQRLDHHAFAAPAGSASHQAARLGHAHGSAEIDHPIRRGEQQAMDRRRHSAGERLHVPDVVLVDVHGAFAGQQVEGRQAQIVERPSTGQQ